MADEKKSRYRELTGINKVVVDCMLTSVPIISILYILNITGIFNYYMLKEQYIGIYLIPTLTSVFFLVPATKNASRNSVPWYDYVLALCSVVVAGYVGLFYPEVQDTLYYVTWPKVILSTLAVILILESCRRFEGWVLFTLVLVFVLYTHFSRYLPLDSVFYSPGLSLERAPIFLYLDAGALLGIALAVASTIIVSFVLFGKALFHTGGGEFLSDLATSLFGKYRGGPAKVAIIGSSLFGMISGSAVANVMTVGNITIPLMKKYGYKPVFAGAVEATASTGGQIMPPVMGSAAFIMAQFLNVPYSTIALAAAIPALLYYLGLFIQVDLHAARSGLKGMPADQTKDFFAVARRGWLVFVPIVLLVYLLFVLAWPAEQVGLYTAASILLLGQVRRETRINFSKILLILRETGKDMLEITVVCAAAGFIIGVVGGCGLAQVFTQFGIQISHGILLPLALVCAVTCIILGMGMPTSAVYILVVILVAPALIALKVAPLVAHMFIFYYACISFITPPVALAAYAAASIAGSGPSETGYRAARLGISGFIVPFALLYGPALLLEGSWHTIIIRSAMTVLAIWAISAVTEGYLFGPLDLVKRGLLSLGALLAITPEVYTDIVALVLFAIVTGSQFRARGARRVAGII